MTLSDRVSRREFCLSAGGISVSLLTTYGSSQSQNGRVVFIYDDSPKEDRTQIFPIHQQENVPGCVAAVSGRIGDSSWLSPAQLREMENTGWEIMSHSVRHRALGEITVTQNINSGDEKIYVESNFHSRVPGDTILISDGEKREKFTVVDGGEDSQGEYLVAENAIQTAFSTQNGVTERYTDDILTHSLAQSKKTLEGFGVEVSSFVLPFGQTRGRVQDLIPQYYQILANEHHGGFNPRSTLNSYQLGRKVFREGSMTTAEIEEFLDQVQRKNALGIFVGHSQSKDLTPSRVRTTIRQAKNRDLTITTLRNALSSFGVLSSQTTTTTTSANPSTVSSSTPTKSTTATSSVSPETELKGKEVHQRTAVPSDSAPTDDLPLSLDQIGIASLAGALGLGIRAYSRRQQ